MRLVIFLAMIGVSFGMRGVKRSFDPVPITMVQYDAQWYSQKLDHGSFDITGTKVWNQRYWVNLDNYEEGGPALIMIGGEGEANPKWMNSGVWHSIAQETKAAMFLLEHRFYGQSQPTEDMSTANLKYLSSRQGLEDLATFITAMSTKHNLTGPWVSFGGSYPGSLSAWLREKYPHLVAGAVSSSGPLFAKLDYFEYLGVVRDAFETTGPGCNEAITAALGDLDMQLKNQTLWPQLSSKFKTCKTLDGNNEDDVKSFLELLIDNLAGIVQYNGRTDFDINSVCAIMRNETMGAALERFAEVNSVSLANNNDECLDHEFSSFLDLLTNTSFSGPGVGWRQWTWQTCTEFGWYQTTNQPDEVFGKMLNLDFFKSWCRQAFAEIDWTDGSFDKNMIDSNTEFGGFNPVMENVVFVHGSIDPWHPMGVLEDLNELAPSIYIDGTSHCADMYDDKPGDSQELLAAKNRVKALVKSWINPEDVAPSGSVRIVPILSYLLVVVLFMFN